MRRLTVRTIFVIVAMASCSGDQQPIADSVGQKIGSSPAVEVYVMKAEEKPFMYRVTSPGVVRSKLEVELNGVIPGTVKGINFRNGDRVTRGSPIVELENSRQVLGYRAAEISLAEKRIAFEDQTLSFSQSRDSLRYKSALSNIRITSGLAAAEVAYEEAKLALEGTSIKAPFSGRVADLALRAGEEVVPGQLVCRLYDPDQFVASCGVLEEDAALLKVGMQADVQVHAVKQLKLSGRVAEINPWVDELTKRVAVRVSIDGTGLFPGMAANITIFLPAERSIIVPKEALVLRSGRQVVFTASGGKAKWNYVTVGRDGGEEIEILDGLEPGALVIVRNNLHLSHDSPIVTR
jgi:RND family efflux transporter MFP subunit